MKIRNRIAGVLFLFALFINYTAVGQNCDNLSASFITSPSRCLSTGSVTVKIIGGSGNYSYKIAGPVNSSFVSSSNFNGLKTGDYTITVKDNITGCITVKDKIKIPGDYSDPHFELTKTDETCREGNNGIIRINSLTGGRSPVVFTIVAPSASFEGRISSTGIFDQLPPGDYSIRMTDSCGAILTRKINITKYDWQINTPQIKEKDCGVIEIFIPVSDNYGNNNADASAMFSNFKYGVVYQHDTSWFSTPAFTYPLQKKKTLQFVVMDKCGYKESRSWIPNFIPSLSENVIINNLSCNNFSVAITGQLFLKNAMYCLYDLQNKLKGCNATGQFHSLSSGVYRIEVKSSCYDTVITRKFSLQKKVPSIDSVMRIETTNCNSYKATVSGLSHFTSPQFSLYDQVGNLLVNYQTSPVFYINKSGSYCTRIKDGCYDTVVNICFRVNGPTPSISEKIRLSDINCADATIMVDSITNLTGASFCLYDSNNFLIACNNTGVFSRTRYGSYLLKVVADKNCFDTVIERVIQVKKVSPVADANIAAVRGCSSVQLKLGGQRLFNADYCLYDASNNLIQCNKTGIFTDIPYGVWCVKIKSDPSCYDTVISRCITIKRAVPTGGTVVTSETQCEEFTATVSGASNLYQPKFILRTATGIFSDSNSTGVFKKVKYGSYCIEMWNEKKCYDTLIKRCFSYSRPAPVASNPIITEDDCLRFSADLSVKQNVFSPYYYLLNERKDTIASNSSGYFKGLGYGSYCIVLKDGCSGLVFERCFTKNQPYISTGVIAEPGCKVNTSALRISYLTGKAPFTTKVFDPSQRLLAVVVSTDSFALISNLPEISKGLMYRVVSTDSCGKSDTRNVQPIISGVVIEKNFRSWCPDGDHPNGVSDLYIKAIAKYGTTKPVVVKMNGLDTTINFSDQSVDQFTFNMLLPATYIFKYNIPANCTMAIYDTVVVAPYTLPSIRQSVAYTCDNGGISVGASVKGGASPFTYEIIGSMPESPSILTEPRNEPIFEINDSIEYSLIRLRGIDACGNAALSDVPILPLADIKITALGNCFYKPAILESDSILHSDNRWYKLKNNAEVFVQQGIQLKIPYLLPADTGLYILRSSINNGCLVRTASFLLSGDCKIDPPVSNLILRGRMNANRVVLNWIAEDEKQVSDYSVERKTEGAGNYTSIGTVKIKPGHRSSNEYYFDDDNPVKGINYYRVKVLDQRNSPYYSNTVNIKWLTDRYYFYPNPAVGNFNIRVPDQSHDYELIIYSTSGQILLEKAFQRPIAGLITISLLRAGKGFIHLKITDLNTGVSTPYKILRE